jgi:hypothetical protein
MIGQCRLHNRWLRIVGASSSVCAALWHRKCAARRSFKDIGHIRMLFCLNCVHRTKAKHFAGGGLNIFDLCYHTCFSTHFTFSRGARVNLWRCQLRITIQ